MYLFIGPFFKIFYSNPDSPPYQSMGKKADFLHVGLLEPNPDL